MSRCFSFMCLFIEESVVNIFVQYVHGYFENASSGNLLLPFLNFMFSPLYIYVKP